MESRKNNPLYCFFCGHLHKKSFFSKGYKISGNNIDELQLLSNKINNGRIIEIGKYCDRIYIKTQKL